MQSSQKLLTEYNILIQDLSLIKEEYEKTGKVILSGVLQRADSPNQNNRIYPFSLLKREADKIMKMIGEDRALGELDHPNSVIVNLANVSHIIREVWWSDKELMGKMEVLNTPSGKILKELVLAGVKVGTSSRGVGSLGEDKTNQYDSNNKYSIVQDDFELITFDMVSNPSTQGAYLLKEVKNITTNITPKQKLLMKIDGIMTDILIRSS